MLWYYLPPPPPRWGTGCNILFCGGLILNFLCTVLKIVNKQEEKQQEEKHLHCINEVNENP